MTTQMPPIEPLDEQEREFARIVRALPGGDPPAALDARILKAAANAAASSRRPTSRLLASAGALWGIGGAAAAVLALGVSWQMMYPTQRSSAPSTAPAAAMTDQADDSSVSIEFKEEAPREFDNSGPPPAPPALAKATPGARPQRQLDAPASAPAAPAPEPFAADKLDEHVAASAEAGASNNAMAPAPIVAEPESQGYAAKSSAERRANVVGAAAAPQASAAADSRARSEVAQAQLSRSDAQDQDRAAVATGSAAADAGAAASGALAAKRDSGLLKPTDWLSAIRRLRDENHRAEAKASLIEFRRRYPYYSIPPDLAPLLR